MIILRVSLAGYLTRHSSSRSVSQPGERGREIEAGIKMEMETDGDKEAERA